MYLIKNSKSPNFQIVYFVNGKRTTVSTKTKDKAEAEKFLNSFKPDDFPPAAVQFQPITLSKFRDEYIDYIQVTKSKHYVRSIKLSFRLLIKYTGDIQFKQIRPPELFDKFITPLCLY